MNRENLHRLLKRQIKEHFGSVDQIPKGLENFFSAVNEAYVDYDKDLAHTENILKLSSQELFKANKELKGLNEKNVKIIEDKTRDLRRTTQNLQNAEKIALLGNFSIDLKNSQLNVSDQLKDLLGINTVKSSQDLGDFLSVFENDQDIFHKVKFACSEREKLKLEDIRLKNDSRVFALEGQVFKEEDNEEDYYFLGVIQDITLIKKNESSLFDTLQLVENYRKAIDQAGIVSITDRTGIIIHVNEKFSEISEYEKEELLGKQHNIVNSGFHDRKFFTQMWQTISSGQIWKGIFRNKSKSGRYYWVDSTIVPFMKDGKIDQYFSIRFDITEKMLIHERVEEQKSFYEGILNNIPVDIAVFDLEHRYLFINPIGVRNPEVRKFLIGKDDYDYCREYGKDISIADNRRNLFNQVKETKTMVEFIDESKNKEGQFRYHLRRFFPVLSLKGELNYLIGFGIDITEKREQELQIKNSLEEKEALLGEVHHRVKNNLALVMGLIELQSTKAEDQKIKSEFNEIQNRISAMALIHEKLYKSNDFAKIDLSDYIQDLVKFLSGFYAKDKNVNVEFRLEKILVSTKKAVPIALITNELITNAYKYAFRNQDGELYLGLKLNGEEILYEISDNGPGIPTNLDYSKTKSLGFKLLSIFVKQLKGKYELINDNGLKILIRFKNDTENFNS